MIVLSLDKNNSDFVMICVQFPLTPLCIARALCMNTLKNHRCQLSLKQKGLMYAVFSV